MKKSTLLACATFMCFSQQGFAEDRSAQIIARDGSLAIKVEIIEDWGEAYLVSTALGETFFLKRNVVCIGEACGNEAEQVNAVEFLAKQTIGAD